MSIEIKRLDAEILNTTFTNLVYGPSGSGKTEYGASAGDRSLFINIGAGIATIFNEGFVKRHGKINPLIMTITENYGKGGFFKQASMMDEVCDVIDAALEKNFNEFDTVVLDDATALRRGAMNKSLELGAAVKNYKSLGVAKQHGVIIPEPGDYFIEMKLVGDFIASYIDILKEAKKNFIVLAHERHIYAKPKAIGEEPTLMKVRPGFTGKTAPDDIMALFDECYHFSVKKQGDKSLFYARTIGDAIYSAKSRWEVPNGIQNITVPYVLEHIKRVASRGT